MIADRERDSTIFFTSFAPHVMCDYVYVAESDAQSVTALTTAFLTC